MNEAVLLAGSVILICILISRFLEKIPVPSMLIFIVLGMFFGEDGVLRIAFNDYEFADDICLVSLIFIMFYGGFGTNLKVARPVLSRSVVLSTVGVAGTAGAVALFTRFFLQVPWLESMLIGAVLSSTDAASVFSILRNNKLALKYHTDSLLEVESGSNDPMSYMLTAVTLALMAGERPFIPLLLLQQILLGILGGLAVGAATVWLLRQSLLGSKQNRTVLLFASMLLAYALPSVLGGNGYLSVYLCGIWLGNTSITQKRYLVHFFDVLTDVSPRLSYFSCLDCWSHRQTAGSAVSRNLCYAVPDAGGAACRDGCADVPSKHPGSRLAWFPGRDCGAPPLSYSLLRRCSAA